MSKDWMICRWRWGLILAGLLLLSAVHQSWAGPPTEQLRAYVDQVINILEDPTPKGETKATERRTPLRRVANEAFDFTEISKRSLACHWQGRTPQEREEFVELFENLLEHTYFPKIERYSGENVQFVREEQDGDFATVSTKITTKQRQEVPVDYRMLRRGDRWLVYDVVVEGISLISNYRTQFSKIIQTSSYQELVKKLKTKHEEFVKEEIKEKGSTKN